MGYDGKVQPRVQLEPGRLKCLLIIVAVLKISLLQLVDIKILH